MKPLNFSLDFRSGVPSYIQIVEQVQMFLANGDLSPGDQLPTVRQLASELRINFNTIARAYRMLDEAGLISTQRGRGTYLLDRPSAEAVNKLKHESMEIQARRLLIALKKQGFAQEEIDLTFQTLFQDWKDGRLEKEEEPEN